MTNINKERNIYLREKYINTLSKILIEITSGDPFIKTYFRKHVK